MSTLTLSGWAQPADALAHLADDALLFDYSDYASVDDAMHALKKMPHTQCVGWSLGGALALAAIRAGVIAPKHLTLIGAPYQFVQSAEYKHAMDPLTYQQFYENYARDPARTKERFLALIAKGDRAARRVMAELKHHHDVKNAARWLPWLGALSSRLLYKNAPSKPHEIPAQGRDDRLRIPTLIIHGDQDAIVSHKQALALAELLPNSQVSIWEGVGHAPHLHDTARLRAELAAHRKAHGV